MPVNLISLSDRFDHVIEWGTFVDEVTLREEAKGLTMARGPQRRPLAQRWKAQGLEDLSVPPV